MPPNSTRRQSRLDRAGPLRMPQVMSPAFPMAHDDWSLLATVAGREPGDVDALLLTGIARAQLDDKARARVAFRAALARDPDAEPARSYLEGRGFAAWAAER